MRRRRMPPECGVLRRFVPSTMGIKDAVGAVYRPVLRPDSADLAQRGNRDLPRDPAAVGGPDFAPFYCRRKLRGQRVLPAGGGPGHGAYRAVHDFAPLFAADEQGRAADRRPVGAQGRGRRRSVHRANYRQGVGIPAQAAPQVDEPAPARRGFVIAQLAGHQQDFRNAGVVGHRTQVAVLRGHDEFNIVALGKHPANAAPRLARQGGYRQHQGDAPTRFDHPVGKHSER